MFLKNLLFAFIYDESVRCSDPCYHCFSQTPVSVDHRLIIRIADRVKGEPHTSDIRRNLSLHSDCNLRSAEIKIMLLLVDGDTLIQA